MIGSSGRTVAQAVSVFVALAGASGTIAVARAQEATPTPSKDAAAPAKSSADSVESTIARARGELANGRAAEAEDVLWDALRASRDPRLLLALGDVLVERANALDATSDLGQSLRTGVVEEARALYDEAAKSADHAVDGALGVANCHVLLDRTSEADRVLRASLAKLREAHAPVDARQRLVVVIVRLAARSANAGDAEAAIAEAATAGDLDAAGVALERLRVVAARGEGERALEVATAAIDAKADAYTVASLCWDAIGGTRLELLLHVYSALLERRPDSLALRFFRGATRVWMRAGPDAIPDLEPCVGAPDVGSRALGFLGRALLQAGRPEDALPKFEQQLAIGGEVTGDALNGLIGVAVERARSRKFADALVLYDQVLTHDPKNLWALLGRPLCHKSLGDLDRAAGDYQDALERLPDEPQLMNDYALLLKARGDRVAAKRLFEQALATGVAPGAADAGENLGIVAFRDEKDWAVASRHFARTLLLDPVRPRIRFYRELTQCDEAAKSLGGRR